MSSYKKTMMKDKVKYVLFSQLYSLLSSGLNFSYSFELLIHEEEKKKEVGILKEVYRKIVVGNEFWKSLEMVGAFTELDCGVVRIGEETGKIEQSLMFLSDYYQKKNEQKRMLTSALSYPLIVIITAFLVLFFMITVVVPMFEQVYSRMGGSLPEITQFILQMSSHFPIVLTTTGIAILLLITVKFFYGKTEGYQHFTSNLLLQLPFIGSLIRKHYQAQFCKLLYLLVSSDVPLLRSLLMLESIIHFYPYRKSFINIAEGLRKGDSFSNNMEKYKDIYDYKLITLIRVGEETNSLANMLSSQSKDITSELEHELKQFGNILEPILILGVGGIVALVLIAMYMPMFQLGQTIS
jgi:type IV pilus assembly protein PilC